VTRSISGHTEDILYYFLSPFWSRQ